MKKIELISNFFNFLSKQIKRYIALGIMKKTKIITGFTRYITLSTIIGTIIVLGVISAVYFVLMKKENKEYSFAKVSRGTITQEISETGTIKMGEEINLSFKNAGKIEKIYVKVGDSVARGQELVRLDASQLSLQLAESESALGVAQAKMTDAKLSLENAEQDLNNIQEKDDKDLNNAYQDALDILDDAYLKIYNCFIFIDLLKYTYFERGDTESISISENKDVIGKALNQVKFYIEKAKNSQNKEDIDIAFLKSGEALLKIKTALEDARNLIETGGYRTIVSNSDKTLLDTQKSNINTVYSNIVNSQQNISTIKINNKININGAESKVSTLKAQLQSEGLYWAQLNQAQAQVSLLKKQIEELTLYGSVDGKAAKIKKEEGEIVQAAEAVITLLPSVPFQIKADIYEEDIVKIEIDNPVDIKLPIFPDRILKGRVISIDPAEKLVEGVVYYEVIINFEEILPEIKPGMSADVAIKILSKDNVLMVPEAAIEKKNGKIIARVQKNKTITEREIKIGMKGSDDMVEVVSGLDEGEEVLIK